MTTATLTRPEIRIPAPELRGNNFALGQITDPEVCLEGPAGTGKSFAALYKIHCLLLSYPGAKALVTRKTNTALSGSAMVTYRENVIHPAEGIRYFGGNRVKPAGFIYPNGSFLAVTGLDNPSKVQSAEFDICFVNEALECDERDIDYLRIRMRKGILPYAQIILDTNPDAPTHWLNQRMESGKTTRLITRHQDNPRYWDITTNDWTEEGRRYVVGILGGLTGFLYDRFVLGLWSAAEGAVYRDSWDKARNVIEQESLPRSWPRYLAFDFGFSNPFVCLWAAVDPDGRLVVYRQLYMTHKLVEEHAVTIAERSGWYDRLPPTHPKYNARNPEWADPLPYALICDHDAEGRATLEAKLRMSTLAANKAIKEGIQTVASRLRPAGDGKPRLLVMRKSLIEVDLELQRIKAATCLQDEMERYRWKKDAAGLVRDEPEDKENHAADTCRYLVMHFDRASSLVSYAKSIWG